MKEKKKGGRFLKQKTPKRRFGWIILLLLIIAGALALTFFGQHQPEQPEVTTLPTEQTETFETTAASTEPDPLETYGYIFDLYARAVAEDWDYERCEENKVCYMVMFLDDRLVVK